MANFLNKSVSLFSERMKLTNVEVNQDFLIYVLKLVLMYASIILITWLMIRYPLVLLFYLVFLIAIIVWYAEGTPNMFNKKK
jgi:hypothetical protein